MPIDLLTNDRIGARMVRVIETDSLSGVVSLAAAMTHAAQLGLDVVQIAPGDIPVCRIVSADRYRFERAKTERELARRQRDLTIDVKEIQLRPVTDDNDIAVKARKARGFLHAGDKVKVILRFKGRERTHRDEGRRIMTAFLSEIGEADYKVDRPLMDGDSDMMIVLGSLVSKAELLRQRQAEKV